MRQHRLIAGKGTDKRPKDYPDISGLAPFDKNRSLAVTDAKKEQDSKRILLLDNTNGDVDELNIDWSQTGRAQGPGSGDSQCPGQLSGGGRLQLSR